MNIYFSYLFCLVFYIANVRFFAKKILQLSFCDLHSAVV